MKYIKQLDSIRAIAVILVIIHHWLPTVKYLNFLPNGEIGVDTFFVLSGFLITTILLDNKTHVQTAESGGKVLKNFYIRRILRIFPIYYLSVLVVFILGNHLNTSIRENFFFYFSYTQNFYFLKHGWDGALSPYWSLAVEEQFYLLWPLVILSVNRKFIMQVIIIFIVSSLISQHYFRFNIMGLVFPLNQFDAFGFGALLSYVLIYKNEYLTQFFYWLTFSLAMLIVLFAANSQFASGKMVILLSALFVITYVVCYHEKHSFPFQFLFNNKILIFLGKISYGLYLFHTLATEINSKIVDTYLNPLLPDFIIKKFWGPIFLIENTIILGSMAWLSYRFIEKPFLKLKTYFKYEEPMKIYSLQNEISSLSAEK